jgi:hypothetical protein
MTYFQSLRVLCVSFLRSKISPDHPRDTSVVVHQDVGQFQGKRSFDPDLSGLEEAGPAGLITLDLNDAGRTGAV